MLKFNYAINLAIATVLVVPAVTLQSGRGANEGSRRRRAGTCDRGRNCKSAWRGLHGVHHLERLEVLSAPPVLPGRGRVSVAGVGYAS